MNKLSTDGYSYRGWFSRNWKKLAGAALYAACRFFPSISGLEPFAFLLLGLDFQVGGQLGTPIGRAARVLHERLSNGLSLPPAKKE